MSPAVPRTVAARITPAPTLVSGGPATPPPAITAATGPERCYLVTAFLNVAPDHFNGYRPGQAVAEATTPDGRHLTLVFTTGRAATTHQAAHAAFLVGNGHTSDGTGQRWPADIRALSVGDVLGVAAPDGHTTHLVISPAGFTTITPPTDRIHLAATSASPRRALPWQPADLTATAHLLAYLAAHGVDFDHPSGHGATTTLRLHTPTGPLTVQPGNWLVHADSGHWQTVTAHTFANG